MNNETGSAYYDLIYCSHCSSLKHQHASSGRDGGTKICGGSVRLQQPEGQVNDKSHS